MPPVARFAVTMHDGDDEKVIRLDGIEHGVGKNVCETAPDIVFKDYSPFRILLDSSENRLHCRDETKLQPFLTTSVMPCRILKFHQCFWMKCDVHLATARLTCAKASSLGIVFTRPLRISSRRRRASATQSWRM